MYNQIFGLKNCNHFTMETLTTPLQQTSNLIGTRFMPLFVLNGAMHVSDEELAESAKAYVSYVLQPAKIKA
jgi:putative NADPH-quinone reductase